LIIYIYGSDSFKKDIHNVLSHSNIKFRLDEHGEIQDLKTLSQLKNAIEDNPNNIYLIDDSKIIKKNSLNQKIKFLKPKDGIEQEYLLDNGIGDISVDSIEELSKHIIKKLETLIDEKESSDVHESIVEIVEEAYENDYIQLDDELSSLLSQVNDSDVEDVEDFNLLDSVQEVPNNNIDEVSSLQDLNFEQDLGNIELIEDEIETIVEEKEINNEQQTQGEIMADEFSEFDTLNEDEILAALDGLDKSAIASKPVQKMASPVASPSNESLDISGSNVDDIAKLISQLLNNKTLEITVKVKN
jgi:hypothetical protein